MRAIQAAIAVLTPDADSVSDCRRRVEKARRRFLIFIRLLVVILLVIILFFRLNDYPLVFFRRWLALLLSEDDSRARSGDAREENCNRYTL